MPGPCPIKVGCFVKPSELADSRGWLIWMLDGGKVIKEERLGLVDRIPGRHDHTLWIETETQKAAMVNCFLVRLGNHRRQKAFDNDEASLIKPNRATEKNRTGTARTAHSGSLGADTTSGSCRRKHRQIGSDSANG